MITYMPVLAAICKQCNKPFPSGFFVGPGSGATLIGNTAGPCPWCGGVGVIPDGVLDVNASDVVRLSQALPTTRSDLIKLAGILQGADLSDPEPVVERIRAEVPGARQVLVLLRDPAFGGATGFLALLLLLLAFLGVRG
jgi:hypothetical protein